jgi:hypothetical protein
MVALENMTYIGLFAAFIFATPIAHPDVSVYKAVVEEPI